MAVDLLIELNDVDERGVPDTRTAGPGNSS